MIAGIVEVAGRQAQFGQQIIGADHHDVDAVNGSDVVCRVERRTAFEHHDHRRHGVDLGVEIGDRPETRHRQRARDAARPDGRILRRINDGLRFRRRRHTGRDDAHATTVQHPRDIVRRVRRHAGETIDPGSERRRRDLVRRLDGERRLLEVDIETIEVRRLDDWTISTLGTSCAVIEDTTSPTASFP